MRSSMLSDNWLGLAVATLLVAGAGWAAVVIDRHREEHGHCAPMAMIDVELPQRNQLDAGGSVGEACSVHASFFAIGGVSDAVRRPRNESEAAQ